MALHFIGKVDTKEEMLVLNELQEQAVLRTLLQKRDPRLYREIYGPWPKLPGYKMSRPMHDGLPPRSCKK